MRTRSTGTDMEDIKPVWEQYGMTLDEYARAFNRFQEMLYLSTKKSFQVNFICDTPRRSAVLTNITEGCYGDF